MPTLLVNENFPVPALKLLRAQGVHAEAVQELMPGAPDSAVLAYARAHSHWRVTFDRDYGELGVRARRAGAGSHRVRSPTALSSHPTRRVVVVAVESA
jgi:predicted nuclease of predicted toxin-antitoxin system